jgi:hypothetical protein
VSAKAGRHRRIEKVVKTEPSSSMSRRDGRDTWRVVIATANQKVMVRLCEMLGLCGYGRSISSQAMMRPLLPRRRRPKQGLFVGPRNWTYPLLSSQKHLAELSPEGLAELEIEALKSSPSLLVQSFRRAVSSGSEKLVREYRRCLLERHLKMLFHSTNEPSCPTTGP